MFIIQISYVKLLLVEFFKNKRTIMANIFQKKEKKRNDILNSAYELFTTLGFSRTTILNIALKAGVGKGTFYLYFDSKEELRDILIARKSSELLLDAVAKLDKYVETSVLDLGFADKVIYITDYIITVLSKDIALLQFISKHLSWGLFMDNITKKDDDHVLNFRTFFMNIIKKEGLPIDHPDLLIFTIIEIINSTCHNIILRGEPVTYSDYKPYLFRTIRLIVEDSMK